MDKSSTATLGATALVLELESNTLWAQYGWNLQTLGSCLNSAQTPATAPGFPLPFVPATWTVQRAGFGPTGSL